MISHCESISITKKGKTKEFQVNDIKTCVQCSVNKQINWMQKKHKHMRDMSELCSLLLNQHTCISVIKSVLFTCKGSFVENCWVIYWQRTLLFLFLYVVVYQTSNEMQFGCTRYSSRRNSNKSRTASKFGNRNESRSLKVFFLKSVISDSAQSCSNFPCFTICTCFICFCCEFTDIERCSNICGAQVLSIYYLFW